jgi:hypothetical protein
VSVGWHFQFCGYQKNTDVIKSRETLPLLVQIFHIAEIKGLCRSRGSLVLKFKPYSVFRVLVSEIYTKIGVSLKFRRGIARAMQHPDFQNAPLD